MSVREVHWFGFSSYCCLFVGLALVGRSVPAEIWFYYHVYVPLAGSALISFVLSGLLITYILVRRPSSYLVGFMFGLALVLFCVLQHKTIGFMLERVGGGMVQGGREELAGLQLLLELLAEFNHVFVGGLGLGVCLLAIGRQQGLLRAE